MQQPNNQTTELFNALRKSSFTPFSEEMGERVKKLLNVTTEEELNGYYLSLLDRVFNDDENLVFNALDDGEEREALANGIYNWLDLTLAVAKDKDDISIETLVDICRLTAQCGEWWFDKLKQNIERINYINMPITIIGWSWRKEIFNTAVWTAFDFVE